MHFIDTVRRWVGSLAELGIAIIALGVVLQVLFGDGSGAVPFLPMDVLGSVVGFLERFFLRFIRQQNKRLGGRLEATPFSNEQRYRSCDLLQRLEVDPLIERVNVL